MTPTTTRFFRWTAIVAYGACVLTAAWFASVLDGQNRRYTKIIDAPRLALPPDIDGDQWLDARWFVQTGGAAARLQDEALPRTLKPTLLLFVADECEPCTAAFERWTAAATARSSAGQLQYLVAYAGRPPVLPPASPAPTLLRLRDAETMRYVLGVRTVPFAALFDQARKMRAAVVGLPSHTTVATCLAALDAYPNGPGFLMRYEFPSQPFNPAAARANASPVQ